METARVGGRKAEHSDYGFAEKIRPRSGESDRERVGIIFLRNAPCQTVEPVTDPLEASAPRVLHELVIGDAELRRARGRDEPVAIDCLLVYVIELCHANSITET